MNGAFFLNILETGLSAAAAVLVYQALGCMIRVRKKRWCEGALLVCCWPVSLAIIFIGDIINWSLCLSLFLAAVWVCCEGSGLKKFTTGLLFSNAVFAFNAFYDNSAGIFFHLLKLGRLHDYLYVAGRFFFALLLYLSLRPRKPERDFELSAPLWRLMLTLTCFPAGIMLSLILLRSPVRNMGTVFADGALFLLVLLSFAGLLRALTVLERQQRLEQENMLAMHNRRYYEAMEQQQFEIRRLRHDLSNHLQTLLALPGEQKDDYIRGMLDNPAFGQTLVWCGDSTVNAVLTSKKSLAEQKGIRFTARVDIGEELPFEKADICAIFANALDNAVEGCMALSQAAGEIELNARLGKGILAVSVKNPYKNMRAGAVEAKFDVVEAESDASETESDVVAAETDTLATESAADETEFDTREGGGLPEKSSGSGSAAGKGNAGDLEGGRPQFPKTTKRDAENHGLGLRSIQETVKKYGGSMEITRQEGRFCLFLYLPVG